MIISKKHGMCPNSLEFLLQKAVRLIPGRATTEKPESNRKRRTLKASADAKVKIRRNIDRKE